jgi:hypothetical protein
MRKLAFVLLALVASAAAAAQGPNYPPLGAYMMEPEAEIALARSAAPDHVSAPATVKLLTPAGFKVAVAGTNGFVCLVLRGWARRPTTPRSSATMSMSATCARRSASIRSRPAP